MTPKSIFRDSELCVNCKACLIACKVKHMSPPHPLNGAMAEPVGVNLLYLYQDGPVQGRDGRVHQSFVGISCMHCEEAPCIGACPTSAIFKDRETRITLVDERRCIGCKGCLWVCPYGAPGFRMDGKMILCDLCVDLLKEGKKTACEAACPARAIFVGSPGEISKLRSKKAFDRMTKCME